MLGRDASLAIAAIYYRYASLPSPKTFTRYWDFSLPSAEVHPTAMSKFNTFLQIGLIAATTALPLVSNDMLPDPLTAAQVAAAVVGMQYVVAGTTLWSGGSYAWRKDVVKILGPDERLKTKQGFRGRMIVGVSFASFVALAGELGRRERAKSIEDEA
jgi:cardiolipin synthase